MIAAPTTQFWRSRPRQVRKGRGAAAFFAALTVYIIVILVAAPQAQQPPSFTGVTPTLAPSMETAMPGFFVSIVIHPTRRDRRRSARVASEAWAAFGEGASSMKRSKSR